MSGPKAGANGRPLPPTFTVRTRLGVECDLDVFKLYQCKYLLDINLPDINLPDINPLNINLSDINISNMYSR